MRASHPELLERDFGEEKLFQVKCECELDSLNLPTPIELAPPNWSICVQITRYR